MCISAATCSSIVDCRAAIYNSVSEALLCQCIIGNTRYHNVSDGLLDSSTDTCTCNTVQCVHFWSEVASAHAPCSDLHCCYAAAWVYLRHMHTACKHMHMHTSGICIHSTSCIMIILSLSCSKKHKAGLGRDNTTALHKECTYMHTCGVSSRVAVSTSAIVIHGAMCRRITKVDQQLGAGPPRQLQCSLQYTNTIPL